MVPWRLLVDDEQIRVRVELQPLLEHAARCGVLQVVEEPGAIAVSNQSRVSNSDCGICSSPLLAVSIYLISSSLVLMVTSLLSILDAPA